MKFRKKPVVIEAISYNGTNFREIQQMINHNDESPFFMEDGNLKIWTSEGVMTANIGDWIIKGVKGEFYPCKPDIFEATYEKVEP